jgi:hypothetical protein
VPVEVTGVIAERRAAWSDLAEERRVRLQADPDGPLSALLTPGRLDQVLDNLLANAVEASPPGGCVTISGAWSGNWVELHVVDQGPGLSAQDRERAFDRFWRGLRRHDSQGDGFGLGLAIAAGCWPPTVARSSCGRPPAAASTWSCGCPPDHGHEALLHCTGPGQAVLLEATHRTQPCLQPAVVALDPIVGMALGAMPRRWRQLLQHGRVHRRLIGSDLGGRDLGRVDRSLEEPVGRPRVGL